MSDAARLVTAFADAVELGDADAAVAVLSDQVAVWHNSDAKTVGRAETRAALAGFIGLSDRRAYAQRRMSPCANGVVFQFVLIAEAGGRRMEMPGCMICTIAAGRIVRIDEYVDPAPLRAWIAEAGSRSPPFQESHDASIL